MRKLNNPIESISRRWRRVLVIVILIDLLFLTWLALPDLLGYNFQYWVAEGGIIQSLVGLYQLIYLLPQPLALAILLVLVILPITIFFLLYAFVRAYRARTGDEPHSAERLDYSKIMWNSYRIVVLALLLGLSSIAAITYLGQFRPTPPMPSWWPFLLWGFGLLIVLTLGMPTLIAAWFAPNLIGSDGHSKAYGEKSTGFH